MIGGYNELAFGVGIFGIPILDGIFDENEITRVCNSYHVYNPLHLLNNILYGFTYSTELMHLHGNIQDLCSTGWFKAGAGFNSTKNYSQILERMSKNSEKKYKVEMMLCNDK